MSKKILATPHKNEPKMSNPIQAAVAQAERASVASDEISNEVDAMELQMAVQQQAARLRKELCGGPGTRKRCEEELMRIDRKIGRVEAYGGSSAPEVARLNAKAEAIRQILLDQPGEAEYNAESDRILALRAERAREVEEEVSLDSGSLFSNDDEAAAEVAADLAVAEANAAVASVEAAEVAEQAAVNEAEQEALQVENVVADVEAAKVADEAVEIEAQVAAMQAAETEDAVAALVASESSSSGWSSCSGSRASDCRESDGCSWVKGHKRSRRRGRRATRVKGHCRVLRRAKRAARFGSSSPALNRKMAEIEQYVGKMVVVARTDGQYFPVTQHNGKYAYALPNGKRVYVRSNQRLQLMDIAELANAGFAFEVEDCARLVAGAKGKLMCEEALS